MQDTNLKTQLPIVYGHGYDPGFAGMEYIQPHDVRKYSRIFNELVRRGLMEKHQAATPAPLTRDDLLVVHTPAYLDTWNDRRALGRIFDSALVRMTPAKVTHKIAIQPLLLQAGGSVLAAQMAQTHGWAINLGGGLHHA